MALAEVIVRRGDRGAAPIPVDDVSTRFEAVISEHGPVGVPIDCRSWSQVKTAVGDHTAYSTLRAADAYFAEGGWRCVLSRVVGPAAATATLALRDRTAATVATVRAEGPGAYYHGLRVTATVVSNDATVTVALNGAVLVTGVVSTAADLKTLVDSTGIATLTIGAGTWPIVAIAETALAGGDDDRANIRDAHVTTALAVFDEDLGPGSVCASGWTSVAVHTALAQHARVDSTGSGHNRFARCDLPDIASASTLITQANTIRALDDSRFVQLLAGYPTITTAGVTLPVAPSGHLTGRETRTDRENGPGPGQPCAQTFGEFETAVGVSQAWSRSDMAAMKAAGITIIVQDPDGRVFAEDAITVVDPARYPQYSQVAGMRVTMAIHHQIKRVLRSKLMAPIDARGHVASATAKDCVGICASWFARDALYGDTPDDAFQVTVVSDASRRSLTGSTLLRPTSSVQTVDMTITQVAAGDTI